MPPQDMLPTSQAIALLQGAKDGIAQAVANHIREQLASDEEASNTQRRELDETKSKLRQAEADLKTMTEERHEESAKYLKSQQDHKSTTEELDGQVEIYRCLIVKLRNEVSLRDMDRMFGLNLQVWARIRPSLGDKDFSWTTTTVEGPQLKEALKLDRVFGPLDGNQRIGVEVSTFLPHEMDGQHFMLFAFGESGSGKSTTLLGRKERGLIQHCISHLEYLKSKGFTIHAVCVEVLSDTMYDLAYEAGSSKHALRDQKQNRDNRRLGLLSSGGKNVFKYKKNDAVLEPYVMSNPHLDIAKLLDRIKHQRHTDGTAANATSSRSHALFQFDFVKDEMSKGRITFVDLAGQENVPPPTAPSAQQSESRAIVDSLHYMRKAFSALATGDTAKLQMNECSLCKILELSFTSGAEFGKPLVMVLGHLWAEGEHCADTGTWLKTWADATMQHGRSRSAKDGADKTQTSDRLQRMKREKDLRSKTAAPSDLGSPARRGSTSKTPSRSLATTPSPDEASTGASPRASLKASTPAPSRTSSYAFSAKSSNNKKNGMP
ncbi:P-loop containing nucleoside triphosphate hydrolase protein [Pyrenochaeta sp. MPI-SDFR-AT-0127]|nr:P-loop containing nucleoside triphosphate hydrolase protein [Pyrenochaeta sp. MPI-SDFR-AT-0127]